jgi:hypothetical protein
MSCGAAVGTPHDALGNDASEGCRLRRIAELAPLLTGSFRRRIPHFSDELRRYYQHFLAFSIS